MVHLYMEYVVGIFVSSCARICYVWEHSGISSRIPFNCGCIAIYFAASVGIYLCVCFCVESYIIHLYMLDFIFVRLKR